jgi:hypothetical protein
MIATPVPPAGEYAAIRRKGDVRRAGSPLFRNLSADAWQRRGVASDQPISIRALAFIIVGHARHHIDVLEAHHGGH